MMTKQPASEQVRPYQKGYGRPYLVPWPAVLLFPHMNLHSTPRRLGLVLDAADIGGKNKINE